MSLTPKQIEHLIKTGQMTGDDIKLLDEEEKLAAIKIMAFGSLEGAEQGTGMALALGGGGMAPKAVGQAAAKGAGVLSSLAGKIGGAGVSAGSLAAQQAPNVGRIVGGGIGAIVGHPFSGAGIGGAIGKAAQKFMGKGAPPAAAPKSSPPASMSGTGTSTPSSMSGIGGATPSSIPSAGFSRPASAASATPPSAAPAPAGRPGGGAPPNAPTFVPPGGGGGSSRGPGLTRVAPKDAPAEALERALTGGVQDNFARGGTRVSIRKPEPQPAYTPNVSTQTSWDDLLEMILGTARGGQPTPVKFHQSAPQNMRHSIDTLKKQTSRRKPK